MYQSDTGSYTEKVQATQVTEKDASAYQKYTPTNFVDKIGKKANMKRRTSPKDGPHTRKT